MNNHLKAILLGFTFVVGTDKLAAQTAAQPHPIDAETQRCKEQRTTTLGLIECDVIAYEKWTTEMDKHYNTLLAKLDDTGKQALKEQQIAWAKLRDTQFAFNEQFYTKKGAEWLAFVASAKVDFVRRRAFELKAYIDFYDTK